MAGMDEVLERLVGDPEFRKTLAEDPKAALRGYELTREDLDILSARLDEGTGDEHGVEQRTSKSAIAGFLAQALSVGGGEAVDTGDYELWKSNFGTAGKASEGYDSTVDADDFVIWDRAGGNEPGSAEDLAGPGEDPEKMGLLIPAMQSAPAEGELPPSETGIEDVAIEEGDSATVDGDATLDIISAPDAGSAAHHDASTGIAGAEAPASDAPSEITGTEGEDAAKPEAKVEYSWKVEEGHK